MANINEILARAAALRDETALNSISPERAGGIMYDTLLALNELWLQQGSALVISKIYASVAAMEADSAPVSDLTGKPLRPGQIVVIASSDSDNGSVYRYNGIVNNASSWTLVGAIGNLDPVDSLDSDSTTLPLAAHQGKVLNAIKVDKTPGKGLSDENYSSSEKTKLGDLPTAAQLTATLQGLADLIAAGKAFRAIPNTTTFAQINAAWEAGRFVYMVAEDGIIMPLAYFNDDEEDGRAVFACLNGNTRLVCLVDVSDTWTNVTETEMLHAENAWEDTDGIIREGAIIPDGALKYLSDDGDTDKTVFLPGSYAEAESAGGEDVLATKAEVNAKYTKPVLGIPAADLAQVVQTSLGKADIAACVTRRGLEETGVAFNPYGESFIVYASNSEYVEVYFIECGDDYTNVAVTMLSNPDTELGPLVDFHPYDGQLLVWPNDAIDFSVIRLGEPGPVEFTNVADKSEAQPKIVPDLFVRKDLLDVLLAEKANVDGYYERLTAGGAEKLIAPSDVTDSFLERTTGGDAEVANGLARINEVKGKSQVWNQLADINAWTTPSGTASGITFTRNYAEGSISVSGTATADALSNAATKPSVIAGHKYYIRGGDINKGYCINVYDSTHFGAVPRNAPTIVTALASGTLANFRSLVLNGTTVNGEKMYPGFIDLTLLGIDNLTTPEQVEAWLAENKGLKPYYPYDAGSILNAKLIGLESYGRNLLNPSTNKARIIGRYSDTYGNYYGITGTYDSISFTSDLGETSAITPDSDGKFVLTTPGILDVVNPGADCAVFLWWDGKKTDFTAYKTSKAYIDFTHIYGKLNGTGELVQVFPEGARGVNAVKDRLYVEDGEVKAKVACGKVADLGALTWIYDSTNLRFRTLVNEIPFKRPTTWGDNGICSKYEIKLWSSASDKFGSFYSSGLFFIKDTAYTDVATFKAAMAGVPLIYELATPLIYTDLVYQGSEHFENGTPVQLPVDYDVDNYGMEVQILGSDSVPAELSVRYQMDAAEAIDTLQTEMAEVQETIAPDNIITAASMDNFLSALGTAMEGTWTKTWNASTGKYEFTFTPNA